MRLATGVVQLGTDWPGYFLRGDDARPLALLLDEVCGQLDIDLLDGQLDSTEHWLLTHNLRSFAKGLKRVEAGQGDVQCVELPCGEPPVVNMGRREALSIFWHALWGYFQVPALFRQVRGAWLAFRPGLDFCTIACTTAAAESALDDTWLKELTALLSTYEALEAQ